MQHNKRLWSNRTRDRHFLVPDSIQLPSGDFFLRTVTGQQQQVDPDALAPYEIAQEEAKEWLKDQFGQMVQSAKDSIMDSIRRKMASEPDLDAWFGAHPENTAPSASKPSNSSPALSLLAALSEESLEQLQSDPSAVGRAVHSLFTQIGRLFSAATSTDEAQLETARKQIRSLGATLQQHGWGVGESLDDLPDKLRSAYLTAWQQKNSEQTAEQLDALADSLQQAAGTTAKWLRGLSQEIRKQSCQHGKESRSPMGF
jgi:hypothetical protein